MNDSQHFENYHFHRTINTIAQVPVSYPLHWHKYVEVVALPSDKSVRKLPEMCVQQVHYRLQPGDLLFIWPGELHELINNEENLLIGMQFEVSNIGDLPEFASFLTRFRSVRHISAAEMPALAESMMLHIRHIYALQESQNAFCGVESLICLLELFMEFGQYLMEEDSDKIFSRAPGTYKLTEKMNLACGYIAENCDREIDLDSVADYVGFSSCYFSRVFKQATNYSFVEYVTLQRVKRAQALLADSNLTVTEVSYQSGFKSISTFNRVFRLYKGCSPREYRKYYAK